MIYISGIDYISIIPYFTPDIVAHTWISQKVQELQIQCKKPIQLQNINTFKFMKTPTKQTFSIKEMFIVQLQSTVSMAFLYSIRSKLWKTHELKAKIIF